MGKPCFSKLTKFFAFALLGAATAIAAIAVLSTPATAQAPGGGGDSDDYPWDTDNLRYSTYTAKTFGIPFHDYSGYSGVDACQSGVADGFFQTVDGGRNDFPVLQIAAPAGSTETAASVKKWGSSRNAGCDEFAAAQDRLVSVFAGNGGYYLDSQGNLRKAVSLPAHAQSRPAAVTASGWGNRAGYTEQRPSGSLVSVFAAPADYAARVDVGRDFAVSPDGTALSVPGTSWPASRNADGSIYWQSSQGNFLSQHLALPWAIGGSSGNVLCPAGFHPRGEDSIDLIGSGTGRTLSSLRGSANIGHASQFWCRSDVRYQIAYRKQTHAETCGADPRPACPSGVTLPADRFSAYGRVNCYYTVISLDTANQNACRYYHPIPQCADADSGTKREYASAELAAYTIGDKFPAKTDGTTACAQPASTPPPAPALADFTADPCVTATLEIYENRIAGSDAEPGVISADRTLAAAGRTAFDLDIVSPHPLTASPPRDQTAGSGDPSGCADGSESRADHAASSGSAARSQSTAPSYASSSRTDSAAPPNDADGDIDYSGAAKNMAHRYASRVAENTCSVKLAEAEAELALLEAREDDFTQWLSDYKTAADSNAANMRNYRRAPAWSGAGLAALRGNDMEAAKAAYAALLATRMQLCRLLWRQLKPHTTRQRTEPLAAAERLSSPLPATEAAPRTTHPRSRD